MSGYQYFAFLAVDRPLDEKAQAEVRRLSTRATITANTFTNTYHFGDFHGDPHRMMQRHYDLHVHDTEWGIRRLMVRVPAKLVPERAVAPYTVEQYAEFEPSGKHLVLEFVSEDETAGFTEGSEDVMASVMAVHEDLLTGDLRPLYLAWLAAIGTWERDEAAFDVSWEDEPEPPVPAGFGDLTAAQQALAAFLRLDPQVLAAAAEASDAAPSRRHTDAELRTRIKALPESAKNRLLVAVAKGEHAQVRAELLRGDEDDPDSATPPPPTVGTLLAPTTCADKFIADL